MTSAYRFSSDLADIDRARVHAWLSEQSYWAAGRAREMQDAAIDGSRNYAVLDGSGRQVAYARVVTDAVTFAWLCDVFVDPAARGNGVGKLLVEGVISDIEQTTVRRIVLATADAHGLYAQYGFAPSEDPNRYMIRLRD
ncbi:N-acetyltransferase [Microbacterium bovistercoris]|uniref:N-acetyltransferase n=1 Tax=Microbacterium bovistercoris TaxID=2293570 RepID=A0A371NT84_9MICO|nr:GNAT family N-acetyltransferase [Microbacterium bovistercoris]REJ05508.1 N-acetyltransferase [Microbacterium bovistercoris]